MHATSLLLTALVASTSWCFAQASTASQDAPDIAKSTNAKTADPPEIIFFNGIIYTGAGLAEDNPQTVQAMAIGDGKVIAVGTNAEIKRARRTEDRAPRLECGQIRHIRLSRI